MRVAELAAQHAAREIQKELEVLQPGYRWPLEPIEAWRTEVAGLQPAPSDLEIVVYSECWMNQDPVLGVDGRKPDGTLVAMDLTLWPVWRDLQVVDLSGQNLRPVQLAAMVYFEMTWHGGQAQIVERKADLQQRLDEVEQAIAAGDWSKFTPMEDFLEQFEKDLPKLDKSGGGGST